MKRLSQSSSSGTTTKNSRQIIPKDADFILLNIATDYLVSVTPASLIFLTAKHKKSSKKNMKAATKIMRQRLKALKLAKELGNVSRVCRERGIWRTQFHEYRERFKEQGFEGLRD